jgi:hypothetical protein
MSYIPNQNKGLVYYNYFFNKQNGINKKYKCTQPFCQKKKCTQPLELIR